ncbi:hypothetical protein [Croceicoccus marinus]|jgi:hypothetical protein|uniref:Uncharacterized protein n=1 Tax=Croceicoccus marinus TaxID=450378 RepID=A0A1Z1FH41_9SPHN|nr:hypothetical protein [Croceicoccus marinus]ARU18075.1 hypothetical protein A9D14_17400 [Croceicoccus marinus]
MDPNRDDVLRQGAPVGAAAANDDDLLAGPAGASSIAGRISVLRHGLGAAAACAWSKAQMADLAQQRAELAIRT